MSLPVVILVNGIRTDPGRTDAWTDRMATALLARYEVQVEKFEYWTWALTRWLIQDRRAQELAALLSQYSGRKIALVGHSNGCALILEAMKIARVNVDKVYLVAPAAEADFELNGLNKAVRSSRLRQVLLFTGGRDLALKFAYYTRKYLLRFIGLGYGSMGYTGPQNVEHDHKLSEYVIEDGGHSAWLSGEAFEALVALVGANTKGDC